MKSKSRGTTPAPPVRRNANLRTHPGDVLVVAYEGEAMLALSKLKNRFVDLCYVPASKNKEGYQGVGDFYVKKHFRVTGGSVKHGHHSERAIFTLLAVKMLDAGPLVTGYVQCTVYSRIHGIETQRLVKIDLVCTQGRDPSQRLKGAASILMKELERYATSQLGANMLVLDSVDDPNTWGFYKALGFTRALDQCAGSTRNGSARNDAVARAAFAFAKSKHKWTPRYIAALNGRYLPAHNIKEDTVFMTKCLRGPKNNARGVVYPPTSQTAIDALAAFPAPGVRTLAVYRTDGPGSTKLMSVPVTAAVPELFGPSRAGTPATPSPRRPLRSATPGTPSPVRRTPRAASAPKATKTPKTPKADVPRRSTRSKTRATTTKVRATTTKVRATTTKTRATTTKVRATTNVPRRSTRTRVLSRRLK